MNLPPGQYLLRDDGIVCHANGDPVSLTEEQHKAIAKQIHFENERIARRLRAMVK